MARTVAVNVAANTTLPGARGPVYPDGSFRYVPIPEREPTAAPVPTYRDLPLPPEFDVPEATLDRRVHLDPAFAEYGPCETYTYGDEHGVKARPLSDLAAGDHVLFYATLSVVGDPADRADWLPPEWGTFAIGRFRLAEDPVSGAQYRELPATERERFASNAHVKREEMDAEVLLLGDPDESELFGTAVPLSTPAGGSEANWLVTDLSSDSGKGPWWRRVMRFDDEETAALLAEIEAVQRGERPSLSGDVE